MIFIFLFSRTIYISRIVIGIESREFWTLVLEKTIIRWADNSKSRFQIGYFAGMCPDCVIYSMVASWHIWRQKPDLGQKVTGANSPAPPLPISLQKCSSNLCIWVFALTENKQTFCSVKAKLFFIPWKMNVTLVFDILVEFVLVLVLVMRSQKVFFRCNSIGLK